MIDGRGLTRKKARKLENSRTSRLCTSWASTCCLIVFQVHTQLRSYVLIYMYSRVARVESKLISHKSTSYLAANNNDAIKAFLCVYVAYWKNKHVNSGRVVVRKFSRARIFPYICIATREEYLRLYACICMICQDAEMTNIVLDYISNWLTGHL